jgi:streptogramin lyase
MKNTILSLLFAVGLPLCISKSVIAQNLYVADFRNNNILKVSQSGEVTTFVSTGLNGPISIAFDATGNLFVANYNANSISKINQVGDVTTFASLGSFSPTGGLAFDSLNNLYSVDSYGSESRRISKIATDGTVSTFLSNAGQYGSLAFDQSGNLFAADYANNAVVKITPAGSLSTFYSNPAGDRSRGDPLSGPMGMTFDSLGNLFVASIIGFYDSGHINAFSPNGALMPFYAQVRSSYSLTFDSQGILYGAQGLEGTISKIAADGTVTTFVPSSAGIAFASSIAFQPQGVPEPSTYALFALGVIGMLMVLRRKKGPGQAF